MASEHCPREAETVRAAWKADVEAPALRHAGMEPALAAHLAECPTCAEIAALAQAFRDERDAACAAAHPPAAGLVWWRAERRAREEAAQSAARPIAFVHGIALGCTAAALAAILGLGLGGVRAYLLSWWTAFSWPAAPAAGALGALSSLPLAAVLLLAVSLLLAPVAIYLALSE